MRFQTAALAAILATAAATAPAQDQARHPGYDKLQMFVGTWTIEGREDRYREKCDWFEGRFMIVCNTEAKRKDGGVTKSMSFIGYLPEEDVVTYHGFNSRGRNETQRGGFKGTTFRVEGEALDGGKKVKSRVTITPKPDGTFTLLSESATDGGAWVADGTFVYKPAR
jgi:hypothetical protein